MLAYLTIVATAFASLLGAPWWVALIGGTVLASMSIFEQQKLRTRFAAVGANDMLAMAGLASLANGWMAGAAAWALGVGTKFVFFGG